LSHAGSLVLLSVILAGCSDGVPKDVDPRYWWRNLSGGYLDGREPPPGRDAPYPNLASVPQRPVPPDAATRAAITAGLASDRQGSRDPLTGVPTGAPRGNAAGAPPVATTQPPAPPRLAAVPPVRLDPAQPAAPVFAPGGQPSAQPQAPSTQPQAPSTLPQAPPGAPPASLLAPPVAVPDLSGPPPAPGSELLAPRRD
jgi:hypothetical protein